jgi:hypothetical protein
VLPSEDLMEALRAFREEATGFQGQLTGIQGVDFIST